MGHITTVVGNILEAQSGIILHGVNCFDRMGAGLAKAIRNKWPVVYDFYHDHGRGVHLLGQAQVVRVENDLYVANCYTQVYYGKQFKPHGGLPHHLDIENGLIPSLTFVCKYALKRDLILNIPRIGCGLAGGDWSQVKPVIEECLRQYGVSAIFWEM